MSLALSTPLSSGREITVEHRLEDARQHLEVGDRTLLVDLVHALADQAELEHRAVVADEARVGGAAGGRELALHARHVAHRARYQLRERTGRRVKGLARDRDLVFDDPVAAKLLVGLVEPLLEMGE